MIGRTALLLASCALGASCASRPVSPVTLNLKPYVGRLVSVEAEIGGQDTPMLFDTGAGVTALTPAAATSLGCEPFGRLVGHRMSGERVDFQRCGDQAIAFNGYDTLTEAYVFDLMALLPDDLPELGGIGSLASFYGRPFTLDLAGQELIIETEESLKARTKNAKEADLRIKRGVGGDAEITAFVRIEAELGDLWFLLDSGNLDHVAISPHALYQLGGNPDKASAPEPGDVFDLDIEIAEGIPVSVTARMRDVIYDGALSEDVMRRFLITFDLANERLWLARKSVEAPE